jgi:hypothetical protein
LRLATRQRLALRGYAAQIEGILLDFVRHGVQLSVDQKLWRNANA